VADPGGSGWPLLVVDVVDPPPVDVLDVVLRALVVVVMPLRVVVVPCAVVVVTARVVVVVVGDGAVVVVGFVVDVVEAPTVPVIPASTAIMTTVTPVVRSRDRRVGGMSSSRMGAGRRALRDRERLRQVDLSWASNTLWRSCSRRRHSTRWWVTAQTGRRTAKRARRRRRFDEWRQRITGVARGRIRRVRRPPAPSKDTPGCH
jgi:hypothetical protein